MTALLLLLLVRNHRYYFTDDRLSETIPKAMESGRLVLAGRWPWLTTGIVNGSGYSVEYLDGVFNPLTSASTSSSATSTTRRSPGSSMCSGTSCCSRRRRRGWDAPSA